MAFQLTLTTSILLNWHEQLEREPTRQLRWPLGLALHTEKTAWLVPPGIGMDWQQTTNPRLLVIACRTAGELARIQFAASSRTDEPRVLLGVGCGPMSGHLAACYLRENRIVPVDIQLIGSEVISINRGHSNLPFIAAQGSAPPEPETLFDTWAPTREALGKETWQRFTSQRFGVIGAGRMGSSIAEALHRNGADVAIFDRDSFEPSNLGESALVRRADLHQPKAQVVAERLKETSPNSPQRIVAVAHSALSLAALPAVKNSTILISAVDNPTARLVVAFLATIYMTPLLDLGTGVFHRQNEDIPVGGNSRESSSNPDREMGADIRLCVPGRCLLCSGGIQNLNVAVRELRESLAGSRDSKPNAPAWFDQRSGSLRSLNGCAVNLGLRLIEDWLAHRLPVNQNHWLHLEFDANGAANLETRQMAHERAPDCVLCSLTGIGDAGLRQLPRLLEKISS